MIEIQQPRPFDIVGDPVLVSGQSVTFEATVEWRITLAALQATGFFTGGGAISVRQFQVKISLDGLPFGPPARAFAHLSLFSRSVADGTIVDLQTIPMILGSRLVSDFEGWQPRPVVAGDSLSRIARDVYGDGNAWPILAEANRDMVSDPDLITIGQVLRIPLGMPIL